MIAGHRWKYDFDMRQYKCVPLPWGGVESHQWCVGCGAIITDFELHESGYPRPEQYSDNYSEGVWLNLLAAGKGFAPIEAGTFAEWKLKKLHKQQTNKDLG